jgi:hypothetical protein
MPDPAPGSVPEKAKTKEEAILFIEINIETQAATIEVVKDPADGSYMCTHGPHPE